MNEKFLRIIVILNAVVLIMNIAVCVLHTMRGESSSVFSIITVALSAITLALWILIAKRSKANSEMK